MKISEPPFCLDARSMVAEEFQAYHVDMSNYLWYEELLASVNEDEIDTDTPGTCQTINNSQSKPHLRY